MQELVQAALNGDRRSLARTLSALENRTINLEQIMAIVGKPVQATKHWQSLAITGAPGVGKSCLLDGLLTVWAQQNLRVALLAVDPSSPRSGGASLGDRVRMTVVDDPVLKERIYLRSIATRKASGSVPLIVADMTQFLLALGWDRVVIETVGAGQAEVRCAAIADRILVVEGPARGDGVQAEDGIRDLVRSRGLGDVYKRQQVFCQQWQRNAPLLVQHRPFRSRPGPIQGRGEIESCLQR